MPEPSDSTGTSVKNGDRCEVTSGTHRGKSGTARDLNLGKTGHLTITVLQDRGERFKTLARNVVVARAAGGRGK